MPGLRPYGRSEPKLTASVGQTHRVRPPLLESSRPRLRAQANGLSTPQSHAALCRSGERATRITLEGSNLHSSGSRSDTPLLLLRYFLLYAC